MAHISMSLLDRVKSLTNKGVILRHTRERELTSTGRFRPANACFEVFWQRVRRTSYPQRALIGQPLTTLGCMPFEDLQCCGTRVHCANSHKGYEDSHEMEV